MPACAPNIVYANSWLGQTSNITTVTLVTAAANALYRLDMGGKLVGGSGGGNAVTLAIDFNQGTFDPTSAAPGSSLFSQSNMIYVESANAVTLSVTVSPNLTPLDHFDLYVVLEQLQ